MGLSTQKSFGKLARRMGTGMVTWANNFGILDERSNGNGGADEGRVNQQTDLAATIRKNSWAQFEATLKMLNESLHTCLR